MRQLLIDKPEGLGFYPLISASMGGGISCVSEDPQLSAPFWIENLSNSTCTVTLTKDGSPTAISLDYSSDQSTWTTFTNSNGTGSFEIPANSKAYVKGDNSIFSTSVLKYYKLSFNQRCNIGGNIMSLVERSETLTDYMFCRLFDNNINIIDASKLLLPATTLAEGCYSSMFSGCTSLTTAPAILSATTLTEYCYSEMFRGCTALTEAPELPATTLAKCCYESMFQGCTSLTEAPELPASELASGCYRYMFYGCTSLTIAPALPATELAQNCYRYMFQGCTSLTTAPALPATTLAINCYRQMFTGCTSLTTAPAILSATTLTEYCYSEMFRGCTALTTAPELPATTLAEYCYDNMFSGCKALTTAPALPATTLAINCYRQMFSVCTKLKYIKAMFTTTPSNTYTRDWVSGVAYTGTFVKNGAATWNVTGANGIPWDWTVETAVA